jgi:hypothetical protein
MSCPYFEPAEPHPRANTGAGTLLPLGGVWTGTCHAESRQIVQPDDPALHRLCNIGYARGVCPRFSTNDPGPDAARFTLVEDDGASLRMYYVLERDHRPFAHGPIEFVVEPHAFRIDPEGHLTARQAAAYAASYLRRKSASSR